MTQDWIKEIQEREAKATPGPWRINPEKHSIIGSFTLAGYLSDLNIPSQVLLNNGQLILKWDAETVCEVFNNPPQLPSPRRNNAEFIAHARKDIPDLINALTHLYQAMEKAPHSAWCASYRKTLQGDIAQLERDCTCWKKEALSFKPEGI